MAAAIPLQYFLKAFPAKINYVNKAEKIVDTGCIKTVDPFKF